MLLGLTASAQTKSVELPNESLHYNVAYKWGFIEKVAGYATMNLKKDGNMYRASLFAHNAPWADDIYKLRDTLYTTMTCDGLFPTQYIYIAHENGKYKKDVVKFSHKGNDFTGLCTRYKRNKPGGPLTKSTITLTGKGMTVDMLSSFYYLRTLDFPAMKVGQSVAVNIFSGSKKEKLTITYLGKQNVKVGGKKMEAYYVKFAFTRDGKQSSDPIEGWISTAADRRPLRVKGQLPVGHVTAELQNP